MTDPKLRLLGCLTVLLAFVACSGDDVVLDEAAQGGAVAVLPGKADDYKSPTSKEWALTGTGQMVLEEVWVDKTDEEKEAEVNRRLGYEFKANAHFVNEYVTDKSSHDEGNADYGGFAGLVRDESLDYLAMPLDDEMMKWEFLWTIEMGGPADLLTRLPTYQTDNFETAIDVVVPVLTDSQLKNASYPKHFNPEAYEGETKTIQVTITGVAESHDAYPEYGALLWDDKIDILILVGGDYNDKRYDLLSTEQIFDWLKQAGYSHPADEWTDLTLDSPPFEKSIRANGRETQLEVTLLHPDIVPDSNLDDLRAAIVKGFEEMDIVLYDGHAGQDPDYSGISYHYNPRKAISANDLAALNLPEKYQIFVFNGCKTYNAYPDALYKSEVKNTKNLDIISTVSFSWLSMQPFTTSGLMTQLFRTTAGQHDPQTWIEILSQINKSNNYNVFYGVHGLDDNPHIHPYADLTQLCEPCTTDATCTGVGNRCIRYDWGSGCAAECTADDGCPEGYRCSDIAEGSQIVGHQCLPKTFRCN